MGPDRVNQGVSGRVVGAVLAGVEASGLDLDELLDGLDIVPSRRRVSQASATWEDWTQLLERLEARLGGGEGLREFTREHFQPEALGTWHRIGRLVLRPQDLYYIGSHMLGPSLFPMVRGELFERENGEVIERLTIRDGHRDCPAFFHVMHGALEAAPLAWGHGTSQIDMHLEPRRARYTIRLSKRGFSLLGRGFRAAQAPFTLPRMLDELSRHQLAIESGYDALRSARDRIARQAHELERINWIGQRLASEIELDQVVRRLIEVLLEDMGFAGAELWLVHRDPSDFSTRGVASEPAGPARLVHSGGVRDADPDESFPLESGKQRVGVLKIWGEFGTERTLLPRLLPWISIALDNARAYDAMARHADELEARVKERTARLLSANHHLVEEINERKRATDALIESEAQRRASERLASMGTLAAGIAHEINNPVASILASAQLGQMLRARGDEAATEATLEQIISEAKRCGDIVRCVLQFSRNEQTEKWECGVHGIVLRAIRLSEAYAKEHGARLFETSPDETLQARVNPIQIEQALINLIRNAVEAGAAEVRIHVRSEVGSEALRIEVCDDGPGIPDPYRDHIFEPFYTTKRAEGGTGLGLSVVHGIAAEHGGRLELESNEGMGTIATLTLPRVERVDLRGTQSVE